MRLTVLVDNHTLIDRYLTGEPALCLYLECDGKRVLFDLGYGNAFLRNAAILGIHPLEADTVVLSHGHIDHTGGLAPLARRILEHGLENSGEHISSSPRLIAHPDVFTPRTAMDGRLSVGSVMGRKQAESVFSSMQLSSEPVWVSERLLFLGEIERRFSYEGHTSIGKRDTAKGEQPDLIPDDTALAYRSEEGLVIVTGCSHAGICNIIEQARRLTGEERVLDVIGGLHLLNPPQEQLDKTAAYLGSLQLQALHACHCTDLASTLTLSASAPVAETGCGLVLEYP